MSIHSLGGTVPVLKSILRCPLHPDVGHLDFHGSDSAASEGTTVSQGAFKCRLCEEKYPVIDGIVDMFKTNRTSDEAKFLEAEARQWDAYAEHYEEARGTDIVYLKCVEAGIRALRPTEGDVILDAGCGIGMGTRQFHRTAMTTVAVDLSMSSLRQLCKRTRAPGICCVRADVGRLPFANKAFTKAICANMLQQLPADLRHRCIRELKRVMMPSGTLVVTVHAFSIWKRRAGWLKEGPAPDSRGDVQYVYRFDVDEFRDLLATELRVERITGAGFPLPYRFKLSPLSKIIERLMWRSTWLAPQAHMLVGRCVADSDISPRCSVPA